MKIIAKTSSIKEKICANCMLKTTCGDVRGLCMLLHYGVIASIVVVLLYLLLTMNL